MIKNDLPHLLLLPAGHVLQALKDLHLVGGAHPLHLVCQLALQLRPGRGGHR